MLQGEGAESLGSVVHIPAPFSGTPTLILDPVIMAEVSMVFLSLSRRIL
jgi:hypothetical protein